MSSATTGNNLNWSVEYYEANLSDCNSILESLESFECVPSINSTPLQNFQDGTLVRYRGMVQDMLNPEYYSSSYTVVNTQSNENYRRSGKFRDIPQCNANEEFKFDDGGSLPKERQVLFCIPIPGTNEWVETHLQMKGGSVTVPSDATGEGKKREASESDDEMDVDPEENSTQPTSSTSPPAQSKKNRSDQGETGPTERQNTSYSVDKYFPFQEQTGLPCLVKIDEDECKSNLSLNNAIEVIGFLSLSPSLEANWEDKDVEDTATHPPPSLVPRVHAIHIRKLKHCNPLLSQIKPYENIAELAASARSDLHLILTQLLFEDSVAADFLLCHLISRVYVRNEGHTIGKFSLNLYNIKTKNFARYLSDVLKMLVTNSHFLQLSVQTLNDACFTPKKDYESNRLWSGVLQLCDDTHLILDETSMDEGRLNNQGCLNVMALQKLFKDQEIQYDFGYYPVSYNANIPVLVVSEGKSMFEADVKLSVKSDLVTDAVLTESYEAVRAYLSDEKVLERLRVYLTSVRLLEFELGEDMVKKIGEDYVSMRQQNDKVNSSDLHTLLVLSRLLALSHGRQVLSPDDWSRAVEMETCRKSRST